MVNQIKVLNINYDSNSFGGVPIFLINVYRNINHDKIKIDFLTPDTTAFNTYRNEIEKYGGSIFELHINCSSTMGKLRFERRLRNFLRDHPYDIVHINSGAVSFDCFAAIASKSEGTKVIIHSHNAGGRSWWKMPVAFFMKLIMQRKADVLCACSKKAALDTFTKRKVDSGDVVIIKNGIDAKKFRYNEEIRNQLRQEFNLENHFVVGHIGRFAEQKNHEFLIDIFLEILRERPDAILLLIGQGELEPKIQKKVQDLHIEKNVIFLGPRSDVENWYQTMDVFLFPSLYEGLPITLLEAQTSGLPCFISDTITKEVDITNLIHRLSLKVSPQKWAKIVLANVTDSKNRCSHEKELTDAGYDIENTASYIEQIYEELI